MVRFFWHTLYNTVNTYLTYICPKVISVRVDPDGRQNIGGEYGDGDDGRATQLWQTVIHTLHYQLIDTHQSVQIHLGADHTGQRIHHEHICTTHHPPLLSYGCQPSETENGQIRLKMVRDIKHFCDVKT